MSKVERLLAAHPHSKRALPYRSFLVLTALNVLGRTIADITVRDIFDFLNQHDLTLTYTYVGVTVTALKEQRLVRSEGSSFGPISHFQRGRPTHMLAITEEGRRRLEIAIADTQKLVALNSPVKT